MPYRSIALTVSALISVALLSSPSSAAVVQTCQGRTATIVGTRPTVEGTPGDDVIVTGTSDSVQADAGNDLVCVTPSSRDYVSVYAGTGDDVIDASAATAGEHILARMDSGIDRYLGGPGDDNVYAYGTDDNVTADLVELEIDVPATGLLGGYSGSILAMRSVALDVEVEVDEQILIAGVAAADIADFDSINVAAPRVVLRGDDADNHLMARGCDVQVMGMGGDDLLGASYLDDSIGGHEDPPLLTCERRASILGGPGGDLLRGSTGNDEMSGGGGQDVLLGDLGNDTLTGNAGSDTLRGNRGDDSAVGGRGRDRCNAERERCER